MTHDRPQGDRREAIVRAIEHVGHLLPVQGPIGVFVHHNTLHAFQHLPFHDALAAASEVFGAGDYMKEAQYLAAFERGRITQADLAAAFEIDGQRVAVATDPKPAVAFHRDVVLARTGIDVHDMVHAFLIRTTAAYLDMGVAYWAMPERQGFYATIAALYGQPGHIETAALSGLSLALRRQREQRMSAVDVVLHTLDALGVEDRDHPAYLQRLLLSLPGWAGMMHRLERNPADRPADAPPASLLDFVAVQLTVESLALRNVLVDTLGFEGPLSSVLSWPEARVVAAPKHAEDLAIDRERSVQLHPGFADLSPRARRRVWHEAYERFHRREVLDALSIVARARPKESATPKLQVLFCIDDREESMRRHIEAQDRDYQTFGLAGFFGLAIRYRGLDDGHYATLCPVVVTPDHVIEEIAQPDHEGHQLARARRRARWAGLLHLTHAVTRSLTRAAVLTPLLGALSAIPLVLRVLFPRTAGAIRRALARHVAPPPASRLAVDPEQYAVAAAGNAATVTATTIEGTVAHLKHGFALEDQARLVAAQLENIGLKRNFAPLVLVLGHGSTSINNPHKSAYDCGACGGSVGAPNARLFAQLANKPEVRRMLMERGIEIPDSTWFIGGHHDTGNDAVVLTDLDQIPATHGAHLIAAQEVLDRARKSDAHERCRRLESAPHDGTPEAALRHVEARTDDLSQARPELGHCTNAVCVVGRRALSRNLFLDRRAFLVSYDATQDSDHRVLERILAAVGPVGAGISLEYYFSFVDNDRYGAGSKLPHNLTGLLGVMDGPSSDLRTGLPQQMIELHDPVRLLLVVEATPEALLTVAERQAEVRELVVNRWIQLASIDPETGAMRYFNGNAFEPYTPSTSTLPHAESSQAWYAGKNGFWDFLPPAVIEPSASARGDGAVHV